MSILIKFCGFLMFLNGYCEGKCEFTLNWHGIWFQSGSNLITINSTNFETKGECFSNFQDKYLIFNKLDNCYKCLAINEKSDGILQYKESICEETQPNNQICSQMLSDDPLHTLIRKNPPIRARKCSFTSSSNQKSGFEFYRKRRGNLPENDGIWWKVHEKTIKNEDSHKKITKSSENSRNSLEKSQNFRGIFSYSTGNGLCTNPANKITTCQSRDSTGDVEKVRLNYEACVDVGGSESYAETLKCLAEWKEGSQRYVIAEIARQNSNFMGHVTELTSQNDEEKFRCLIWERKIENLENGEFSVINLAQSADATCNGVFSAYDGSKTLKIIVEKPSRKCKLPHWLWQHRNFYSQNLQKSLKIHESFLKIHIKLPKVTKKLPKNEVFGETLGSTDNSQQNVDDFEEILINCAEILEEAEGKMVKIIGHVTKNCENGFKCMIFRKKADNLLEIEESADIYEENSDICGKIEGKSRIFTNYLAQISHQVPCPNFGFLRIYDQAATNEAPLEQILSSGCENDHQLVFFENNEEKKFACHSTFQENSKIHVVITPVTPLLSTKNEDLTEKSGVPTRIEQLEPSLIKADAVSSKLTRTSGKKNGMASKVSTLNFDQTERFLPFVCFVFEFFDQTDQKIDKVVGVPQKFDGKLWKFEENCRLFRGNALNFTKIGFCEENEENSSNILKTSLFILVFLQIFLNFHFGR